MASYAQPFVVAKKKHQHWINYPQASSFVINNLDSTCVLIGQQVCFHSAMKHENDVSNVV